MKKFFALVLAVLMVFALAACGSSVDPTAQLNEIQATLADIQTALDGLTTAAAAPAEEEPAVEEPAALEVVNTDTLKIGLLVNQTGWFAGVDTTNYNEFNAMVDYVNNDLGGWVVGDTAYTLEAICVDGQSDYPILRNAAMSLVDAGVDFVVETNDFWVNSCADVFEDEGILHASAFCVSNTNDYLVAANPLAFTGSNGTYGDFQACFEALKQYYPDVHTIVFANDQNGSEDATYAYLEELAAANGFEMAGMVIYPGETADYTSYAKQMTDIGADAFMGSGSPDAYGALLKAIRALGDDMVMVCAQGKPISMVMAYAGEDASYNGFTLGASTREEDKVMNPDMLNAIVAKVGELYGEEASANFDGAAANTLYLILQMMQRAGSVEPADVAAAWEEGGTVDSLYGPAVIGGTETYGVTNHAVGHPRPVSLMDPDAEDGWYFADWIQVNVF